MGVWGTRDIPFVTRGCDPTKVLVLLAYLAKTLVLPSMFVNLVSGFCFRLLWRGGGGGRGETVFPFSELPKHVWGI